MTFSLIVNDILAFVLCTICWWLAHQNARDTEPYGKFIASGYAAVGLVAIALAIFRTNGQDTLYLSMLIKASLIYTLGMVALRLEVLWPPEGGE